MQSCARTTRSATASLVTQIQSYKDEVTLLRQQQSETMQTLTFLRANFGELTEMMVIAYHHTLASTSEEQE